MAAEEQKARKWTQYVAALGGITLDNNNFYVNSKLSCRLFSATLGGFALGNVIGWSSPAADIFDKTTDFSESDITWIASIMPLGAATATVVMAFVFDVVGRKWTMVFLALPFVLGWMLLAFSSTVPLFMVGRFITGFSGGAFCIAAPTYTGEIAEKSIRGRLGVFFQLLLVIGILVVYALGEFHSLKGLTLPCSVVPILFAVIIIFMPESPVFCLKKKKDEKARKALKFFRGENYNLDAELKEMAEYAVVGEEETFWGCLKKKATMRGCLMLLGLHIIQQLSGINIVMFYAHKIFEMAGSSLSSGISAIILAIVQVLATGVAAYVVDRLGRKLLFMISLAGMCACQVLLGVYFMIDASNHDTGKKIAFLPLLSICIYLLSFSLGTGPLPWAMLGELIPNRVKGGVGSFVSCLNWMLAFGVTGSFTYLVDWFGAGIVFFAYAVLCGLGLVFIIFILIETKNKSLDEIQKELGAKDG